MKCKKANGILFYLLLSIHCFGQKQPEDSVFNLKEVVVNSFRYQNIATGATVKQIDSFTLQSARSQSVSDILMQQGGIIVTSYGQGGLANAAIRGNSSNHTAIVWNDINLQSPMNGSVNLSVIPVCMIDNLAIQYGGSGVAYGSGAMSGIIHIGNDNLFNQENGLHLNLGMGSFGNKILSATGKSENKILASNLKVFAQQADNDFSFPSASLSGTRFNNQTNAGVGQFGILQENQLKSSKNSVVKTSVWYQHYDKDIQTRLSADTNNTNQKDNNLIVTGNWKYLQADYSITCKSGFVFNQVLYRDQFQSITNNHSSSGIGEVEYKKVFGKHFNLHTGINNTYESAISNSYNELKTRNRTSFYGALKSKLINEKLHILIGIRNESVNFSTNPTVFNLGGEAELIKWLKLKGNISTNYRIPTLNDLYWREDIYASGNPKLVPESGWSADAGFVIKKVSIVSFDFSNNVYYSKIKNWIVWEPNPLKKNKWMPDNRELGQSYGLEFHNNIKLDLGTIDILTKNEYSYNKSLIIQKDGKAIEEPLLYNPTHHYMFSAGGTFKSLTLFYIQNLFSKRLTDLAGGYLPHYETADLSLGIKTKLLDSMLGLYFRINNIWNAQYQVRKDYAMPMRNYLISLSFDLNRLKE